MPTPLFVVDAFTDRPFAGNPAAVCVLNRWPTDAWLQNVGREMNLSETAFLVPRGANAFDLRWFTPAVEVDLCGHATLAAATAAWEGPFAGPGPVTFHTRSGPLSAVRRPTGEVELDFPAQPAAACAPPHGLLDALGAVAIEVARNGSDLLVTLASAAEVRALRPDFRWLAAVECRGVIVTAPGDEPGVDFVSRFFAPAAGVDEDPVTGSAHCCLSEYWGDRLGKSELVGYQASARGGVVRVSRVVGRVKLIGRAVLITRGELLPTAAHAVDS